MSVCFVDVVVFLCVQGVKMIDDCLFLDVVVFLVFRELR